MTVEQIKERVANIEACRWDFEVAHSSEDELMLEFIRYVAIKGSPTLREMAQEVLKAQAIDFPRYCA